MPILLLDKRKCLANIGKMAGKAKRHGLFFRPHFKTHQSAEIGNWFRDFGVSGITVSSFRMAAYFSRAGWKDILVAFPLNPLDVPALEAVSASAQLSVLLDNPAVIPSLGKLRHPVDYYIDIDTGYGRTGIEAGDHDGIAALLEAALSSGKLRFRGFYCHAGHSYRARDRRQMDGIHREALAGLAGLGDAFRQLDPIALYGDTPGCSMQEDFTGIHGITPGNFVFYDLMQWRLGSCSKEEIAVALSCPVSGKYPDGRLLVRGGAIHFSKENLDIGGRQVYGQVAEAREAGWGPAVEGVCLDSVSQEHGIIRDGAELLGQISVGDRLYILPVHSCLAANLMRSYRTLDGQNIPTMNS
jgi:D-serine deaminase-like pyridoxal phosphate-dependent protein